MRNKGRKVWQKQACEIAQQLATKAAMKQPKITIKASTLVQARAGFGEIDLFQGLLDCIDGGEISEDSLRAIIAHEIGHIKNRDDLRLLGWRIVNVLPTRFIHGPRRSAQQHLRESEFAADRVAVDLIDGETVITALREMKNVRRINPRWMPDNEHPTLEERIAAIRMYKKGEDVSD